MVGYCFLYTSFPMPVAVNTSKTVHVFTHDWLVGWSLTSLFSTNTATSETSVFTHAKMCHVTAKAQRKNASKLSQLTCMTVTAPYVTAVQ